MAHAGVGSVSYVGCLLLNNAIGIKPTLVPFTGTAPVMNAILAGQVDYDCDPVLGPLPHVRAGTAKALAIATKKRSPLLPDVPTRPSRACRSSTARRSTRCSRPRARRKPIVDKLAEALNKGLDEQAVRKRLDRSRRRHRRAGPARPEGAGRAGAERGRAADADPEGGERRSRRDLRRAIPIASANAARTSGGWP